MGIFDRWRRKPDDGIDQSAYDILDEVEPDEQMVDEAVDELLLPGFTRFDDIVESVVEQYEGDVPDVDEFRELVTHRTRARWSARRADEATWGDRDSQYDALDLAFFRLSANGFVTGMNLGVDQQDGYELARDARTPDGAAGFEQWAYVYFHRQDADGLCLEPTRLRLSFGSFRPAPNLDPGEVARAVASTRGEADITRRSQQEAGRQVAELLTERGFDVDWDGTAGRRIGVAVTAWRKPLPFGDLDEARRVVAAEGLRVVWPGETVGADAAALEQVGERWHVWATDERAGAWSDGSWHDDLGEALDQLVRIARFTTRQGRDRP